MMNYLMLTSATILTTDLLVEHRICIGDPQQLRPTLTTYGWYHIISKLFQNLILLAISAVHG